MVQESNANDGVELFFEIEARRVRAFEAHVLDAMMYGEGLRVADGFFERSMPVT